MDDLYEDSDSEIEIDASKFNKSPVKTSPPKNVSSKPDPKRKSAPIAQPRKTPVSKAKPPNHVSDSESEEENEKLMLSIADIKVHVCWHHAKAVQIQELEQTDLGSNNIKIWPNLDK